MDDRTHLRIDAERRHDPEDGAQVDRRFATVDVGEHAFVVTGAVDRDGPGVDHVGRRPVTGQDVAVARLVVFPEPVAVASGIDAKLFHELSGGVREIVDGDLKSVAGVDDGGIGDGLLVGGATLLEHPRAQRLFGRWREVDARQRLGGVRCAARAERGRRDSEHADCDTLPESDTHDDPPSARRHQYWSPPIDRAQRSVSPPLGDWRTSSPPLPAPFHPIDVGTKCES